MPTGERSAPPNAVAVALPLPVYTEFTYTVKGPLPAPGTRVLVPFQRGERIGWVVGGAKGPMPRRVKSVLSVLEDEPSASDELLQLFRWMSDYYVAPLGVVMAAALPSVLTDVSRDVVALTVDEVPVGITRRAERVAEALLERGKPVRVATLRKSLGMGSIWPELRLLMVAGALSHETIPPQPPSVKMRRFIEITDDLPSLERREEVFGRARRQREAFEVLEAAGGRMELSVLTTAHGFSRTVLTGLENKGVARAVDLEEMRDPFGEATPATDPPPLTEQQARVVGELVQAAEQGGGAPFLLHGITGSGKTRVYIELLKAVRARGKGGIVLVPEISLTPQTVKRFRAHFGDEVAVLHSGLSDGERYDAWRQLKSGEKRIAVGARSALFAPVKDLGVIVVDEEHDGSYKQSEAPRYQARDLAVMRATIAGGVCLLGSATPSLESWSNASKNKFRLLSLPDRVAGGKLPPVELIDLREVRKQEKKDRKDRRSRPQGGGSAGSAAEGARGAAGTVLAPDLVDAVTSRLKKREQVILLLNRRGYASFIQCRECGDVRRCRHCAVSLTFHRASGRVVCHHCRYEEPAPKRCPQCGSEDLDRRGLGTEQVERVVMETFPNARVARMDVDTTSGKWAHQEILGRVERGEVDILLGTQMIAKGLDFPRVTLVGVVNADVGIHLPDFRAGERTFQLLSQVSGRAGRGPLGGRVLIQTSMPDHYVLQAVKRHDYEGFAKRELEERLEPPYPPHLRMVNVVLSSPDDRAVLDNAEAAVRWVDDWLRAHPQSGIQRVGPAPAPIERLHGRFRWHFLLRGGHPRILGGLCKAFMSGFQPRGADVRVALDRDPVALL